MTTKLIEGYATAFPMCEVLLVTAGVIAISALYLYYKEGVSIDIALSLQFLWLFVPGFLIIGCLNSGVEQKVLEIAGHIGTGIVLGSFLAFCLYVAVTGTKKVFRQILAN